jgi:hypothetical protein
VIRATFGASLSKLSHSLPWIWRGTKCVTQHRMRWLQRARDSSWKTNWNDRNHWWKYWLEWADNWIITRRYLSKVSLYDLPGVKGSEIADISSQRNISFKYNSEALLIWDNWPAVWNVHTIIEENTGSKLSDQCLKRSWTLHFRAYARPLQIASGFNGNSIVWGKEIKICQFSEWEVNFQL